jgi:hypothetical protein
MIFRRGRVVVVVPAGPVAAVGEVVGLGDVGRGAGAHGRVLDVHERRLERLTVGGGGMAMLQPSALERISAIFSENAVTLAVTS